MIKLTDDEALEILEALVYALAIIENIESSTGELHLQLLTSITNLKTQIKNALTTD